MNQRSSAIRLTMHHCQFKPILFRFVSLINRYVDILGWSRDREGISALPIFFALFLLHSDIFRTFAADLNNLTLKALQSVMDSRVFFMPAFLTSQS